MCGSIHLVAPAGGQFHRVLLRPSIDSVCQSRRKSIFFLISPKKAGSWPWLTSSVDHGFFDLMKFPVQKIDQ